MDVVGGLLDVVLGGARGGGGGAIVGRVVTFGRVPVECAEHEPWQPVEREVVCLSLEVLAVADVLVGVGGDGGQRWRGMLNRTFRGPH